MPNQHALQGFYGTIHLSPWAVGIWFREQMLLKYPDAARRIEEFAARPKSA